MEAKNLNITILTSASYDPTETSYSNQMKTIVDSGARVIVYFGYDYEMVNIIKYAKSAGLIGPKYAWVGSDGLGTVLETMNNQSPDNIQDLEGFVYSTYILPENDFKKEFQKRFYAVNRLQLSMWALLHSDCLISIAYGLRKLYDTGFTINQILSRSTNVTLDRFLNFTVVGTTGELSFQPNGDRHTGFVFRNIVKGKARDVLITDFSGHFDDIAPIQYPSGSYLPPTDHLVSEFEDVETHIVVPYFLLSLNGIGLFVVLGTAWALLRRRKTLTVKITSLPFLLLACSGFAAMFSSVIVYILDFRSFDHLCSIDMWLTCIGYALFIQGYLPKLLRIYTIFSSLNKSLSQKQDSGVMNDFLVKGNFLLAASSYIPLANIITLTIWTYQYDLKSTIVNGVTPETYHFECKSPNDAAFETMLLAFNGIHLMMLSFVAYKSRSFPIAYQENNYVLYGCAITLVSALVVMAIHYTNSGYIFTARLRLWITTVATIATFFLTVGRVAISSVIETKKGLTCRNEMESALTRQVGNDDGCVRHLKDRIETNVFVKDSSKLFAVWKLSQVTFYKKSLVLTVIEEGTNVGPAVFADESTIVNASAVFPNCAEIRIGRSYLLLFPSKSTLDRFLRYTSAAFKSHKCR
ncbi:hypothetical protein HDU97_002890 [Phlyctochytrium planicorne]|nr:hypothetical protein HDU97_002890 [Phlyctochytrium planicorne]